MNTPLEELIPFLGAWGLYGLIGAVSRHQQQYSSTQRLFFFVVSSTSYSTKHSNAFGTNYSLARVFGRYILKL